MLAKKSLGPEGHSRTQRQAKRGLRTGLGGVGGEARESGGL